MPSWLSISLVSDRSSSFSRRRLTKKDSSRSSAKSLPMTPQTQTMPREPLLNSPPISDKHHKPKNSNERHRALHKRSDTVPTVPTVGKHSVDDEHNVKNFTVGNVGAGGILYLRPSRAGVPNLSYAPATPSATSEENSSMHSQRALLRESDESGTWTPRFDRARQAAMAGIPVPPVSLGNARNRRRTTRSHSFSTVSDLRSTRYDANEFQLPPSGEHTPRRRRRSSADAGRLGDIYIPHYRLGTPRFSDRGTAYLHYSIAASTDGGVPSSVLSRAEFDKLFPVPPGQGINSFYSHLSGPQPFLHPSSAYAISSASRTPIASTRPSTTAVISPALFDKLERNLDDPTVVRYHPATGRIMAATPARLIAQITSPQFLDYELLADFFLTFRCFMPSLDVLEFLFSRMRWAFASGSDAGRIARVRTFVALRHWILNYFADDFTTDAAFRQSFCDCVNELAISLRTREDRGGGDINIIGELKKCWRRTCALYWPIPDAHEASPDADIVPGGEPRPLPSESALSLPLTIRPTTGRRSIFEMTQILLPDRPDFRTGTVAVQTMTDENGNRTTVSSQRTASIPASPMSEQSLEVLSCSVPFLRYLRPTARARTKPSPPKILDPPPGKSGKPARPKHGHKRSGSFTDALRDKRVPLASPKPDNIELKDLPAYAITGGLVRGILLQPSAAKVDNNVPVTPGPPAPETEGRNGSDSYFGHPGQHNVSVRKFVGEVRRALSSRKGRSESPGRSVGSSTSGGSRSRTSSRGRYMNRMPQPDFQQLPGPDRLDILGLKVENAYQDAVDQTKLQNAWRDRETMPEQPLNEKKSEEDVSENEPQGGLGLNPPTPPRTETPRPVTARRSKSDPTNDAHVSSDVFDFGRLNSHVTTGSRSIVIVDATGAPQLPMMSGGLPSFSSASTDMMPIPLFRDRNDFPPVPPLPRYSDGALMYKGSPAHPRSGDAHDSRTSDDRMHDLLTAPNAWEMDEHGSRIPSHAASSRPRRSSSVVHSTHFQMPTLPHQLRRRPGGDLKAADHVHELEAPRLQRRHSEGSVATTASRSYTTSGIYSGEESGGVILPESRLEKQRSVSLIQALSSQPILRPSFVAEADRLKSMPDADEGGGIEDALLKLEGKIPSPAMSDFPGSKDDGSSSKEKERESPPRENTDQPQEDHPQEDDPQEGQPQDDELSKYAIPIGAIPIASPPRLQEMASGELKMVYAPLSPSPDQGSGGTPVTETQGASIYHPSESGILSVSSQTEYPLPYCPVPEMAQVARTADATASLVPMASLTQYPIPDPYPHTGTTTPESFVFERKPESMLDVARVSSARYPSFKPGPWGHTSQNHASFLLDDNETLSDISTQLSSFHEDMAARSFYFDDTAVDDPLSALPVQMLQLPPTPPSTLGADQSPDRRELIPRHFLPYGKSDRDRPLKGMISHPRLLPQTANQPFPRRPYHGPNPSRDRDPSPVMFPAHLPFVLAFESEVIAEQLTIIEKDALDEVDWKDLISLNWTQNPADVRNWVDYLNRENANGIDVVIARFNLVVKWCVSEIVLTDVPSERARAITKYIHIASHCHRLHNYASMYQIVLALLSADLARLHRTWSLVAAREKQMLEQLEHLCRPFRNFRDLRAEMETAMPGNGIIPFIGLYTHDLMFNALKSSRIDMAIPDREPLVNFERYQTAATIVKNLLRLIEASARYAFSPEPEALSRCLWIAALDDREIEARSKALEQI